MVIFMRALAIYGYYLPRFDLGFILYLPKGNQMEFVNMEEIEVKSTVPEIEEEKALQSFDNFFDDIGSGWSLVVIREAPKEYKGFLEEIPIENPETVRREIDLGYLSRKWGGEVIKLLLRSPRGVFSRRILIEMRSYAPKMYGKTMGEAPQQEQMSMIDMFRLAKEMNPPPTPVQHTSELTPILNVLLEKMLNPPPTPAPQSSDSKMLETLEAITKMRELVQPAPEGGALWETVASKAIESLMPLIAEKMAHSPVPQRPTAPRAQVVHTIPPPPPSASAPTSPAAPPPPSASAQLTNTDQVPDENLLMEMAQEQLGKMSGEDITNLYLAALNDLPENKRAAALDRLESELFDEEPEIAQPANLSAQIPGR